ncbi:MAG: 3-ketoacyl-CoA thiolase [Alphaproteobacteria bacterium MarineAlpha5_Bin12]|nr:MAG: 3-ketoacyl-CoA thiolase [Alphaproteobacteria bacterium MarineAlpha5_Bin12]
MSDVVIAKYVRSPFTPAKKGSLKDIRADNLAAQTIKGLLENMSLNPRDIEDVIIGCANGEGEQGLNVARVISFLAGIPISAGATTVNRLCASSMTAIHNAAGSISLNAGELFICGGVESMSHVPMIGYNFSPNPKLQDDYPEAYCTWGQTAENVAKKYQITKKEQNEFAFNSHMKTVDAQKKKNFDNELIKINVNDNFISADECVRPDTTLETLNQLKPAFIENGSVTAGNSSPITDGATALLVCSLEYAKKNNIEILAKIRSIAVHGCEPDYMGLGPIGATNKALKRSSLTMKDIGLVELNEAFASQSIACVRELEIDEDKLNIDGGAIAIGHPLGATGARITGKAASLLKREGVEFALATQCIGSGQGLSTILQAV